MAKKVYHLPLQQTLSFIKTNKAELKRLLSDTKQLEYKRLLGKSYYYLEIEEFVRFFKVDKDISNTLKSMEYFNGTKFFDEIYTLLNFSQFDFKNTPQKDFFYAFCYIFIKNNPKLFNLFTQKIFLHFHTTFNNTSNINIDYKELALTLIKSKKTDLKESFGETEKESFFKILLDDKIVIDERGKLIKTLRKKAYRTLFFYLLDLEDSINLQKDEAFYKIQNLRDM